jgi:hypothetical protein
MKIYKNRDWKAALNKNFYYSKNFFVSQYFLILGHVAALYGGFRQHLM